MWNWDLSCNCLQRFANMRRLGFRSHQPINPLQNYLNVLNIRKPLSPSLLILAVSGWQSLILIIFNYT